MSEKTCKCGTVIPDYIIMGRNMSPNLCPPCLDALNAKEEQEAAAKAQDQRDREWNDIVPAYFRHPENFIDQCRPEYIKAAQDWIPTKEGKGLFFADKSGTGKSTAVWIAGKKAHDAGFQVKAIRSSDFCPKISTMYGTDGAAAYAWIQELINAPVLIFDDIGKGKQTEKVEEAIFEILDARMLKLRPFLGTSNHSVQTFLAAWSSDKGAAVLRRIKETAVIV